MAHAITIVATSGADVDLTADGDRIFDLAGTTRSGSPVIEGVSGSLIFEDAPYTVLFQSRSYPGPPGEVAGDLPESWYQDAYAASPDSIQVISVSLGFQVLATLDPSARPLTSAFLDDGDSALWAGPSRVNVVSGELSGDPGPGFLLDLGSGRDVAFGGAGDDQFRGESGRDRLVGRAGDDKLLGGGGVDGLFGNAGEDVLDGGGGDDEVVGADGDDRLRGGGGDDLVDGGDGNDRMFGDAGEDAMIGGQGRDTVRGGDDDDRIEGAGQADRLFGEAGGDQLYGGGGDDVFGGAGRDLMFGEGGKDAINGDAGDDRIFGGGKRDVLSGGDGDDVVRGDGGGDLLAISNGDDKLFGDGGADSFVIGAGLTDGRTVIRDFSDEDLLGFEDGVFFERKRDFQDFAFETRKGVVLAVEGAEVLIRNVELDEIGPSQIFFFLDG